MTTQQQADVDLALELIGGEWINQDAFDAAARNHRAPPQVREYAPDDYMPPFGYGPSTRHIWGAQVAVSKGLIETRRRGGRVEYRRVP